MTPGPPEPRDGQETDPPDVDLALKAAIRLLRDVADRFGDSDGDADLRLRSLALRAALVRLYRHRHPGGA